MFITIKYFYNYLLGINTSVEPELPKPPMITFKENKTIIIF